MGEKIDYFEKEVKDISNKKLFLLDMDGTIYNENNLFDGTKEFLNYIKEKNGEYIFITNNSSKSVDEYVKKVNNLGIQAKRENFLTSAQATIYYLKDNFSNKKIYCQGTKALIDELKKEGINVTERFEEDIDIVLVGFDTEFTSEKINKTCEILSKKDVPFIATNPDLCCPVSFGFIPDCGAICDMITKATGKIPKYIGKPEPLMVELVLKKLNYSKDEAVVVGDRLYTDIMVGINSEIMSICVLTGEATPEDILNSEVRPNYTFENINELYKVYKDS